MRSSFFLICVILLVAFALSVLQATTVPNEQIDLETYKIMQTIAKDSVNGNYSSRKVYYCSAKNGELNKNNKKLVFHTLLNSQSKLIELQEYSLNNTLKCKQIYAYDNFGKIVEICYYKSDGSKTQRTSYQFGSKGHQTGILTYNSDDSLIESSTYNYNDKGIIIDHCLYYSGYYEKCSPYYFKILYQYDDKNQNIQEQSYNSSDSSTMRTTYKYDNNGNITEERHYDISGLLSCKATYRYDSYGHNTEECNFNRDSLTQKIIFHYDSLGNIMEKQDYKSDNSLNTKTIYKYDNKSKLTEWCYYFSNGVLHQKTSFKYDLEGNRIEELNEFFNKGNLSLRLGTCYKYDKFKNLIERSTFANNKLTSCIIIEYN